MGYLHLFLQQFNDVAEASNWNVLSRLLNLWVSMEGGAANCGHKGTVEEILAYIRARYGLTEKQALDKLSVIRKPVNHSFHEYADEFSSRWRLHTQTRMENSWNVKAYNIYREIITTCSNNLQPYASHLS